MANWDINAGAEGSNGPDGLMTTVDNDQGTIRAGGNIGATDKFSADAVNLGSSRFITVVSGVNGIESVNGAAGWVFNGGDQVIVRVTTDIAGVSNNVLLAGASNSANASNSINQVAAASSYNYKTAVRTGGWHEYSGVFDPAVTVSADGYWSQETDSDASAALLSSGVDNASNPTAAIPGELVYRNGSPTPVQDDYAAKNLF